MKKRYYIKTLWSVMIALLLFYVFVTIHLIFAQTESCQDRTNKSEPPSNIWIEVRQHWDEYPDNPGRPFVYPTPFTLDEYTSGVLLGELGPNVGSVTNADLPSRNGAWEDATLEGLAVAIRSFTWFRLNYAGQFADPHFITLDSANECGFYDTGVQTFRPFYIRVSQEIKDHYTSIVTEHVPNIYLVEGNGTEPIDAEYRATVGEYSDADASKNYLVSIYDPISANDGDPPYDALGLGQWGAQRWAMGLNDSGVRYPRLEFYQQIPFHYFSTANLRAVGGGILTPAYRWNPLIVDWGGGAVNPPTMNPGSSRNVTLHLQNTGTEAWGDDVKLVYYWLRNGVRSTNSTQVDVDNLDVGDDQANVTLPVQVPGNFSTGDTATLVIDLRRTGDSSGRYFNNRESGRPWFALTYSVCVGGECKAYLPVVMKAPPCPNNRALLDNGDFEAGQSSWIEFSKANYQLIVGVAGAHSGQWYAYMGGYANTDDRIYQNFELPVNTPGVTLEYYVQIATQDSSNEDDFLYVRLRTADGQNIKLLDKMDNTDTADVWHHRVIQIPGLAAQAGQTLRLSFEVTTDSFSDTTFSIDDVSLKTNCSLSGSSIGASEVTGLIEGPAPPKSAERLPD